MSIQQEINDLFIKVIFYYVRKTSNQTDLGFKVSKLLENMYYKKTNIETRCYLQNELNN